MYKQIFSPHASINALKISLLTKGCFVYVPSSMEAMEYFYDSVDFFFLIQ